MASEFESLLLELPTEPWLRPRPGCDFAPLTDDLTRCGRQLPEDARAWFEHFGATPVAHSYGLLGYSPASTDDALEWRQAFRTAGDVSSVYASNAFVPVFVSPSANLVLIHAPLIELGPALYSWAFFKDPQSSRIESIRGLWSAVIAIVNSMTDSLPRMF